MRLRSRIRYWGRSVECPVCGRRFSSFAPAALGTCPACGSLPRHRLLWLYLSSSELLKPGNRILHVAPEAAIEARLSKLRSLAYTTMDLEATAMVKADLQALPFDDASFDGVVCSHVLEHIPDDRAAMREMRRVVGPTGVALIQTPVNYDQELTYEDPEETDPEERLRRFSQSDHLRVYGRDLPNRLGDAGFSVSVIRPNDLVESAEVDRFGLVPRLGPLRNDLYCCVPAPAVRRA